MTELTVDQFLAAPLGSIERPAEIPQGTYLGTIVDHKVDNRKINDVNVPYVEFKTKVIQAEADVDPELLALVDLTSKYVYPRFDLNEKGSYACQKFLQTLFPDGAQASIKEYLALVSGKHVVFKVTHTRGKTPDTSGEFPLYVNVQNLKAFTG